VPFEAELEFIAKWLKEETAAPLLILGEGQSGKKTLLCEFLRSSRATHAGWLHLCHFSSITPHYSHILYRIMIELRVHSTLSRTTSKSSSGSISTRKN
jgi:hypothetical protein